MIEAIQARKIIGVNRKLLLGLLALGMAMIVAGLVIVFRGLP